MALLAPNCPEWLEVFCGVHRANGVVVPVSERLTAAERAALLGDAGVAVLAGAPGLLAETPFSGLKVEFEELFAGPAGGGDEVERWLPAPDDLAVIAYTSGTTGTPKGAMWSHRALFWSAQRNPFSPELAGGRRILVCAPLSAGGAIVMACNALAIGATALLCRFTPDGVLAALGESGVEFTGLVPTMIAVLVEAAPRGWRAPRLRRIYYGGGRLSPDLFAAARQAFHCEFEQAYAMTETCILGTRLSPADHDLRRPELLGSAGKPMPGVGVKVVGAGGRDAPPGEAGEVLIRSPGNMMGYWRRVPNGGEVFRAGWYCTRDIGRFDAQGYLYLVDRKDDMIKSGGLNVFPAEVEAVLGAHPQVEEVAVIGVPDKVWGESVTAVVRLRPGAALGAEELIAHCRSHLAHYKCPRAIRFAAQPLPRTGLGKVSRRAVREQYGREGRA